MKEFRISPEAVKQLRFLRDASIEAKPEHAVRVFMSMGFCGGPQWGFSLDTYRPDTDECCDFDDMKIVIERDLLEAMGGIDVSLLAEDEESDSFLVSPLDPDVNAFFEQQQQGCGGCHGCGGGCHGCGGCGGCHDHDDCSDYDGEEFYGYDGEDDACCGCEHCGDACEHCGDACEHCGGCSKG